MRTTSTKTFEQIVTFPVLHKEKINFDLFAGNTQFMFDFDFEIILRKN